jgi:hypothetical protein
VHLAFYFPGGSIPGQDPFDNWLARFTIQALEEAGALVLPVRYDDSVLTPDWERFDAGVRREVGGALAFYEPDRVTVLGKSRGTQALRVVCTTPFELPADTRLIWQTPVWRSDRAWEAACSTTFESLHLVGLADHEYHDPERHRAVPGRTIEFPGGDHGLEIAGDLLGSLDNVRTMAAAIIEFAARR